MVLTLKVKKISGGVLSFVTLTSKATENGPYIHPTIIILLNATRPVRRAKKKRQT